MILQVITPQKETFDLPVSLPKDYLGKQVHCLFYIEEEAKNVTVSTISPKKTMANFTGVLSENDYQSLKSHTEKARKEWNRDI